MRSSITAMAVAIALVFAATSDAFFGCNTANCGSGGYDVGCGANCGDDCGGGYAHRYCGWNDYTQCGYAKGLWEGFCTPHTPCASKSNLFSGLRRQHDCCGSNGWWYGGNQQVCCHQGLGGGGLGGCRGGLGGRLGSCGGGLGGGLGGLCGGRGGRGGCGNTCGGGLFQRLRSQMACRSWVGGGPLDCYGVAGGFENSGFDYGYMSQWAAPAAPAAVVGSDEGYAAPEPAAGSRNSDYAPESPIYESVPLDTEATLESNSAE